MSVFRQSALRQVRLGGIKAGPPARPGPRCHGNDPKQRPGVRHRSDSSDDLFDLLVCRVNGVHASEHPPQCSVLPGTGVALLELSVSIVLSVQCSVLPGTGVALLELSVSSSVCSVLGAARYRCGATGVVCLPFVTTLSDSWALVLLAITRGYSELELKIPRCWRFCFIGCSERSRCIWSNYFQF